MPIEVRPAATGYDVLPPQLSPATYIGDVLTTKDAEPGQDITAGFFRVLDGEPLVFTYPYDEMKLCLDSKGDMTISDEAGHSLTPKFGDAIYIKKGSTVTFKATGEASYGNFYYVALKPLSKPM